MATFISHSVQETDAFARSVAEWVCPGLVLGLTGDLGSGKTQFVKALGRALGITEPVLSPTFALLHIYSSGRLPVYHLDLYRLDTTDQIVAAGLHEYFTSDGVAVVEWWNRWQGPSPTFFCELKFEALSETERRITYDRPRP
jgi:tRNA threonylcarbamoyladenosine biosynthesis protein TsaE